jgi:hypothetical protein
MRAIVLLLLAIPIFVCVMNGWLNRKSGTRPHRTPFTAGRLTNIVFLPVYLLLHIATFGISPLPLAAGALFMLIYINCLVFLNWFIFTVTDVSMHIQLLMQIYRSGPTSQERLVERYNKNSILGNRVPRLIELGQLRVENDRLLISGKSVLFGAFLCRRMRHILGIPERPEQAHHGAYRRQR